MSAPVVPSHSETLARSKMPVAFRGQNYAKIKKDCASKGVLFEDPEFPASSKSLYTTRIDNDIQWLRPGELCKVPRLVVEGITCDDLVTGELNNSWFVTACTALAHEPKMWARVVPDVKSQEWGEPNVYAGVFHFNFWRFGQWVDVVIDDRLPVKDGKLIFLHSKAKNEFWSALLEKAYAKLFCDYEALGKGYAADALVDFTGGVSEKLNLTSGDIASKEKRSALFSKLSAASDNNAFINCHIKCDPRQLGMDGPNGLLLGQGYNVKAVKSIEVKKSFQSQVGAATLWLVRVYNPWSFREWTGPWSDGSSEWKNIPSTEWAKMGVKFEHEGEFWMSFDDFISNFTNIDICHSVNTSFFTLKKSWNEIIFQAEWSAAGRNGGNDFNSPIFLSNPQFVFDIPSEQPEPLMVSIEQRDVTEGRVPIGDRMNIIGFYIMKVEENRMYRVHIPGKKMFQSDFQKSRSIFGTCSLAKGRYVLVPCCGTQGSVGAFVLRLYTGAKSGARELDKDGPKNSCCTKYKLATTVTVQKVTGLKLPPTSKPSETLDPYVIIRCAGEKIQSLHQPKTENPEFNLSATFYRKNPAKQPITVEIYNRNRFVDEYLCEARIEWNALNAGTETPTKKTFNLTGRKKEAEVVKPGTLHVIISSSYDLQEL